MPITMNVQGNGAASIGGANIDAGPFSHAGTITPVPVAVVLVSGNNTIAVPTGSVGVVVMPPATNNVVLRFKSVLADTGNTIPQGSPSLHVWDTSNPPSSVYLNAASALTGYTTLLFF